MRFLPNWAVIGFKFFTVISATQTWALFDVDAESIFLAEQRCVLEGVHSRESADRAAESIQKLKKQYSYYEGVTNFIFSSPEIERLINAQFYGSEQLAKGILGDSYLYGLLPISTLTDEVKQELVNLAQSRINGCCCGGPGYSTDEPWRPCHAKKGINPIYLMYPNAKIRSYVTFKDEGSNAEYTCYDVWIIHNNKKYEFSQWFVGYFDNEIMLSESEGSASTTFDK